ncbi:hypothetical protein Mpsy_3146 [Methanolobus psychrophilus R15]|nr:hypothetical protein Mpsy_3146 [Methanolobus psychrophilus R15]
MAHHLTFFFMLCRVTSDNPCSILFKMPYNALSFRLMY